MAQDDGANKPLNLLALDGGGIRGVSELVILHEIMMRVQWDLELERLPLPCDYFHLIGGSSTGGLIALMLGRLRMSTEEVLVEYNRLARRIFSKENRKRTTQEGRYKASTLETEFKEVVGRKIRDQPCARLFDPATKKDSMGRTFVCAIPTTDMAHTQLFRSYSVPGYSYTTCEVWEAARATSAAPVIFKPISISEPGKSAKKFVDAGLRCNNPTGVMLEEASRVFGSKRRIGCIVSIGTGHPGVIGLSKPGALQGKIPTNLIAILEKIATDTESTAMAMSRRFESVDNVYFRFNVLHGAGQISFEEWKRMGEVVTHTKAYLQDPSVNKCINAVVALLCSTRN